jgi:glycosyltransferase domain-containing protein
MELSNVLTMIVPLRGREQYTKRLLEFSEWCGFPFKIIFGDGGEKDISDSLRQFKNVDFEYVKCPIDVDKKTYHKKTFTMASLVKTPLVMHFDNDNFYCLSGIYEMIKFMKNNKDYCGARGGLTRCEIINGKLGSERRKIHHNPSILGETAVERVDNCIKLFHTHLHDVVRTPYFQCIHEIIYKIETIDLKVYLLLNGYLQSVFGKTHRNDNTIFIFHEDGTPRIEGVWDCRGGLMSDYKWVRQDYWDTSVAQLVSCVGSAASVIDNIDLYEAKKQFALFFIDRILNRKDDGHKIPEHETALRNDLKNSIEKHIENSYKLNTDNVVIECVKKYKQMSVEFDCDDVSLRQVSVDSFRNEVGEFLKQTKFRTK